MAHAMPWEEHRLDCLAVACGRKTRQGNQKGRAARPWDRTNLAVAIASGNALDADASSGGQVPHRFGGQKPLTQLVVLDSPNQGVDDRLRASAKLRAGCREQKNWSPETRTRRAACFGLKEPRCSDQASRNPPSPSASWAARPRLPEWARQGPGKLELGSAPEPTDCHARATPCGAAS
jgi:hypothetical protein